MPAYDRASANEGRCHWCNAAYDLRMSSGDSPYCSLRCRRQAAAGLHWMTVVLALVLLTMTSVTGTCLGIWLMLK